MTTARVLVAIVLMLLSFQQIDSVAARGTTGSTPESAVTALYRTHFARADLMYLCRESVRREKRWFSRELNRLLDYELTRYEAAAAASGGPNNHKPFISADVLTDSQSTSDAFHVGRARRTGDTAVVTVSFRFLWWKLDNDGRTRVRVIAVREAGRWVVDNIRYEADFDLKSLLSRPNYFRNGT